MINIFQIFKRKNETENGVNSTQISEKNMESSTVLEEAEETLKEVEKIFCHMKDPHLFTNLLFFIAYYSWIIVFYEDNMEHILSVKELLLLKYIPMMKDILVGFDENNVTEHQKEELLETIASMNEKLYGTIKNIKEQQELNLNVDLKTIQDLIQSDF